MSREFFDSVPGRLREFREREAALVARMADSETREERDRWKRELEALEEAEREEGDG